jgi:hypothetical protein
MSTTADDATRLTAREVQNHQADARYAGSMVEDDIGSVDVGGGALHWPTSDDDTEAIALWLGALDRVDARAAEIRDHVTALRRDLTARLQAAHTEGPQS